MEEGMVIARNLKSLIYDSGQTPAQVARGMGISKTTLSNWMTGTRIPRMHNIDALAEYLGVTREQIVSTGVPESAYHKVKILGYVQAGIPTDMITDILDEEDIPKTMARNAEYFGLRIRGSSMEPMFMEGDNVIIRKQPDVDSGDIAIVAVNGDDATCKVVKKSPGGLTLMPKNPSYDPLFFTNEEVKSIPVTILGKVVELRRKM